MAVGVLTPTCRRALLCRPTSFGLFEMTVTVSAPNGATVDFPDGTDHDTINKVMSANFSSDTNSSGTFAVDKPPKMSTFDFTSPDGKRYSVQGPEGATPEQAFQILQSQIGGKTPDAMPAPAPATPAPDKYQQAAIDEARANPMVDAGAGLTRRLLHGATLGADNTILAAADTPFEMYRQGTWNPMEGYNYGKAREDRITDEARKNTGVLGDVAEMAGGAATGLGLTRGGVTLARYLAPDAGLVARTAASAGDAAGLGGVAGFNEGNGLGERLTNAAKGAGTGLAVGAALPVAATIAKSVASPITSNLRALINPEGYATSQIARAVHESGQTPQQLGQRVADANAEGTPLTLADALGNPGQRMLSTVTRAPGQGRTEAIDFLNNRQAGQGRRVTNALSEGFDTRMTPEQLEGHMTDARSAQADADYGAVRDDANPVDVSNVIDHIDQHLKPFGVPHDRISPDGITGRMLAYRRMLAGDATNLDGSSAGGLNDFNAAQGVRNDLSDEVQKAVRAGENNKARLLNGVLRHLDSSLEDASPGFRQANADFRGASQDVDAIAQGRTAATRGRTEDTIPAFNALRPRGQQAFRTGYADPLIANTQGAAMTANKARPLMNDAFRDEAAVIAPRNTQMQRKISNENTMFETRNQALGNSKTAENFADDAAMAVDPHLVANILTGNVHGALRNVLSAGHTMITGNTPAVRAAVGRMLLDRGVNPTNLQNAIGQTIARIQFMQQLARGVGRAGSGALAVARPGQTSN
jgi:hypothetical protein